MSSARTGAQYVLPMWAAGRTQELLRERGLGGQEGYVVWVGPVGDGTATVMEVWPVSARAGAAHARVSFTDMLALAERIRATGWFVLAQVHSHPATAFHSSIDDAHPLSHQVGFLSIVVPDFARRPALAGWSWHQYLGEGQWRALHRDELERRVRVPAERRQRWWNRLSSVISGRRSWFTRSRV